MERARVWFLYAREGCTAAWRPQPARSAPQAVVLSEELPPTCATCATLMAAFRARSSASPQPTRASWQRSVRSESINTSSTHPPEQVLLEGSQHAASTTRAPYQAAL